MSEAVCLTQAAVVHMKSRPVQPAPQPDSAEVVNASPASVGAAIRERAQVEARYLMALQRPRDVTKFRQLMLDACRRPRFAESALYARPQGKESIEGFSVRFAEAAASAFGNLRLDQEITSDSPETRTVQIHVTDLEANLTVTQSVIIEKTVERRSKAGRDVLDTRQNSYGDTVYVVRATEDEAFMKQNSAASKALRTAILRVLPADILDECEDVIAETRRRDAKAANPAELARRIVGSFSKFAVGRGELEALIGHPLEQATPEELEQIRGWRTALDQPDTTWADIKAGLDSAAAERRPQRAPVRADADGVVIEDDDPLGLGLDEAPVKTPPTQSRNAQEI